MTNEYFLSKGSHKTAADGRCAMEWVSYLAGEPHSASPACVSPVLTSFCVSFNDVLPDDKRQRLRPYLARTIGTRGDAMDDQRAWMATDWLVRTYAPAWLSLAGLKVVAERLRVLPPILATENSSRAMIDLGTARSEADAAWTAACTTSRAAARDAGWTAAWTAARAAARDAAWTAARAAAGDAARAALAHTVTELQESAFGLLDQMLPTKVLQLPVATDANLVCGVLL